MSADFYETLSVDPTASQTEIEDAVRKLTKTWNNRRRQSVVTPHAHDEIVSQIRRASAVLTDPQKRNDYDIKLGFNKGTNKETTIIKDNIVRLKPSESLEVMSKVTIADQMDYNRLERSVAAMEALRPAKYVDDTTPLMSSDTKLHSENVRKSFQEKPTVRNEISPDSLMKLKDYLLPTPLPMQASQEFTIKDFEAPEENKPADTEEKISLPKYEKYEHIEKHEIPKMVAPEEKCASMRELTQVPRDEADDIESKRTIEINTALINQNRTDYLDSKAKGKGVATRVSEKLSKGTDLRGDGKTSFTSFSKGINVGKKRSRSTEQTSSTNLLDLFPEKIDSSELITVDGKFQILNNKLDVDYLQLKPEKLNDKENTEEYDALDNKKYPLDDLKSVKKNSAIYIRDFAKEPIYRIEENNGEIVVSHEDMTIAATDILKPLMQVKKTDYPPRPNATPCVDSNEEIILREASILKVFSPSVEQLELKAQIIESPMNKRLSSMRTKLEIPRSEKDTARVLLKRQTSRDLQKKSLEDLVSQKSVTNHVDSLELIRAAYPRRKSEPEEYRCRRICEMKTSDHHPINQLLEKEKGAVNYPVKFKSSVRLLDNVELIPRDWKRIQSHDQGKDTLSHGRETRSDTNTSIQADGTKKILNNNIINNILVVDTDENPAKTSLETNELETEKSKEEKDTEYVNIEDESKESDKSLNETVSKGESSEKEVPSFPHTDSLKLVRPKHEDYNGDRQDKPVSFQLKSKMVQSSPDLHNVQNGKRYSERYQRSVKLLDEVENSHNRLTPRDATATGTNDVKLDVFAIPRTELSNSDIVSDSSLEDSGGVQSLIIDFQDSVIEANANSERFPEVSEKFGANTKGINEHAVEETFGHAEEPTYKEEHELPYPKLSKVEKKIFVKDFR